MRSQPAADRLRARGASSVATMLEVTVIMAGYVLLYHGQRVVSDTVVAERAARHSAMESVVRTAADLCRPHGTEGGTASRRASTSLEVDGDGAPDPGNIGGVMARMGLRDMDVPRVYTEGFETARAVAVVEGVRAAEVVGGGSSSVRASHELACKERPHNGAETAISTFSRSIYKNEIEGY